jgi:hypothetical protein
MASSNQGTHPSVEHRSAGEGTIRAIVQDAYGSPEVLRLEHIDMPAIAANEVTDALRQLEAGLVRGKIVSTVAS